MSTAGTPASEDPVFLVAPSGGVVRGSTYANGDTFAVAMESADAGKHYQAIVAGPVWASKARTVSIESGDAVYLDSTTGLLTSDTSKTDIGAVCLALASTSDAAVSVVLGQPGGVAGVTDAVQFKQKAAVQVIAVAAYPTAVIDTILQVPCVAGTYLVEAYVRGYNHDLVTNIATDVLTSGGQKMTAYRATSGVAMVALNSKPDDTAALASICSSLTNATTGTGENIAMTSGQHADVSLMGSVVTSGAGTIGITHCNSLGSGNDVPIVAGSWLKVTKIA